MNRIIRTTEAPLPIGPYNQAILKDDTLYASGQIAIDPTTNELISGNIKAETKQVMDNLAAVLREADMDFTQVVKCSIFISDMNDFNEINQVYGLYFNNDTAPARETVQVAVLPKNVNVEISLIAVR
ncbi:MAG: 2-iminobutanoate/2-iminopropanoate deaminase [Flavobacteriales bacterium]|jgi:2-iminobutanoate/2-iminopropanoate deaminase|nr:MAG: RidA family protein [Flavobacteriales bacterium]CAI8274415.1 MAG: 2-iminobutanoate/2-iminopropanoate deaminase [Flavobacteriales bacterium]|tara:strand:- start:1233 stop:1613 length:381 start_codon:yes stop_codon:yes gene_type:complete